MEKFYFPWNSLLSGASRMSFEWGMLVRPIPAIILIIPFAIFPGLGWHEEEVDSEVESSEHVTNATMTELSPVFYPAFILEDFRVDRLGDLISYPHLCAVNLIYWYGVATVITYIIENLPEKISEVRDRRKSGSG
jgi:hypothetical protein